MISQSQRSVVEIKDALSVVDKSIKNLSQYIDVYPDDEALKFSLHSAKNMQANLFKELRDAYALKHRNIFDICLTKSSEDLEHTFSSEIPAATLGGILTTFQELLTAIVYHMNNKSASKGRIPEKILQASSVNVATVSTGSFRIIFSDNPNIFSYTDQPTAIHDALEAMNNILFESNDINNIKRIREEFGLRVFSKYKRYINSIVKNKIDISFYDQLGYGRFNRQTMNLTSSRNINEILTKIEEHPVVYEELTGILDTLGQKNRQFKFYTENGTLISGKFIKNLSTQLSRWDFNKHVSCTFKHERQYIEVQDREFDRWTLVKINTIID